MKLYSKPNKNGKRQFLGWEASYWVLKKKYDYLAKGYWKEQMHSEQVEKYQESQRVVMEKEQELFKVLEYKKNWEILRNRLESTYTLSEKDTVLMLDLMKDIEEGLIK